MEMENNDVDISGEQLEGVLKELRISRSRDTNNTIERQVLSEMIREAVDHANDDDKGERAARLIMEAREYMKKNRLVLNYKDWCLILKVQLLPGAFNSSICNQAANKSTQLFRNYLSPDRRDIDLTLACIFSGYEEVLPENYPVFYYTMANRYVKRHPYFKENSLSFMGKNIPYHAVYVALQKVLPNSLYTQTAETLERRLPEGRLGFPNVWKLYSWTDFLEEFADVTSEFKNREGREFQPADLLVAALLHRNRYHGLQLFRKGDCPVFDEWLNTLPKELLEKTNAAGSAWKKIE